MTKVSARSDDATSPDPLGVGAQTTDNDELRKVLSSLDLSPRKRRWPLAVLGVAAGIAGTIGMQSYLDRNNDTGAELAAEQVVLATAPVETRDLLEEVEWNASLGFGETVEVTGTATGTITEAAQTGETLERGDRLAVVGDTAVVVLYGEIPPWRDLREGSTGADVRQLETNLVALGFDTDVTVTIDDDYTYNTSLMVERWQESLGVEPTGEVQQSSLVVVRGPVSVTTAPVVGAQAGAGALATLEVQSVFTAVVNDGGGVIDSFAPPGTPVEHGTVLFELDDVPVVALTQPDAVGALVGTPGADAEALEFALRDGGFDPASEMTVDGVVTDATRAAVQRWQQSTGLPVTGAVDASGYVLLSPVSAGSGLVVDAPLIFPGTSTFPGRVALALTAPTMSTVIPIVVADADEFAVGMEVEIELADEALYPGVVSDIGTTVTQGAGADADPTIDVTVVLTGEVSGVVAGPALVRTISSRIDGATVAPTRALISLIEGGFAVERSEPDGTTSLLEVELGVFSDGMVELLGSNLVPGDLVVVPS